MVPRCYVGTWDLIYIEAVEVEVSRMTEGIMAGMGGKGDGICSMYNMYTDKTFKVKNLKICP